MKKETKHHVTVGGIVVNDEGHFLAIERDVERNGEMVHEIRLPKGHIDPGETDEQAALREVGEESGYWDVAIVADLGAAHIEFDFRGKHHTRDEHYFLMRLTSPERAGPRFDAGSEEALFTPLWLAPEVAEAAMTYASEREFVARALGRLEDR